MKLKFVGCFAALFFATAQSDAAVIVQYDTSASTTNAALVASAFDTAVSANPLTAGSGLTAAGGATWNWTNWDTASTTFDAAVAADDFFTWGFSVVGLNTVDLTTLEYRWDRSATGPDDFELRASVNGGTAVSLQTFDFADTSVGIDFLGIDLTSLGSLSGGDSVVFTFAAFNSESAAGTFDLETIDFLGADPRSLRINGTVTAIPEPSTYVALSLIAVGGLVARRRRAAAKA